MNVSSRRIVFLINENLIAANSDILTKVHLSCLRILTHYAYNSTSSNIKTSLSWGYKFYNVKQSYKLKTHKLHDFTFDSFNQFERDLYTHHNESHNNTKREFCFEIEQLRLALTEILTDYQWDRPELFSPVKRSTQRQTYVSQVFLFTSCPRNLDNSSGCFVDSLLTNVLKEKLCYQLNISLVWVNTSSSTTKDILSNIENGLKQIKGKLVQLDHLSLSWIHNTQNDKLSATDMVLSQSALLHTLLPTYRRKSKQSPQVNIVQLKCNDSPEFFTKHTVIKFFHDNNLLFTKESDNNTSNGRINFVDFINKKDIQLSKISYEIKPCFYSCDEVKTEIMEKAMKEKKAFVMSIAPLSQTKEPIFCYLIPYTFHMGVVIFQINSQSKDSKECDSNTCVMSCDGNDASNDDNLHNEKKDMLNEMTSSKQQSLQTSLTNIMDPWFIGNAYLGFPVKMKKSLSKLYNEDIKREKKCENNSQHIINYMKEKIRSKTNNDAENKDNMKLKITRKKNLMKGLTWARWRLLEYQKNNEENNKENGQSENNSTDEGKSNTILKIDDEQINDIKTFEVEEDLVEYCKNIYMDAIQDITQLHHVSSRLLQAVHCHFKKDADDDKDSDDVIWKMKCLDFMQKNVLKSDVTLKKYYKDEEQNKTSNLKNEYILQTVLVCSSVRSFMTSSTPRDDDMTSSSTISDQETGFVNKVVSLLRSFSFEQGPMALQDFLRTVILPRYSHTNAGFLRHIYDELMIDLPEVLEDDCQPTENVDSDDDDKRMNEELSSSVKSLPHAPSSVYSFDGSEFMSSVGSYTGERQTTSLRRHSSFIGDNTTSRKTIVVSAPPKKSNRRRDDRKKKEAEKLKGKAPVTPRRRKSAPQRRIVPDTPEAKQLNDLIWKKQERERRHSLMSKKMKPVEESPLKELSSPVKRVSKPIFRSNSFQVRSSPRTFYTLKRHHTSRVIENGVQKTTPKPLLFPSKTQLNSNSFIECTQDIIPQYSTESLQCEPYDSDVINGILTRKTLRRSQSVLLMNFMEEGSPTKSSHDSFISRDSNTEKKSCRKNIFENRWSSTLTSGTGSSIHTNSSGSIKRQLSSSDFSIKKQRLSEDSENTEPFTFKIFGKDIVNDPLDTDKHVDRKFIPDTTSDWVSLIAKEQDESPIRLNMKDELDKAIKTPRHHNSIKCSPTIVKTGDNTISVSPCLSASSLQLLENAPILSPELSLSSKRRFKRKKQLADEY